MLRHYKQQLLFAALGFRFRPDGDRQREKIDEALGIFRVVAAHGEAGEVRAVERERRNALRDVERALPQLRPTAPVTRRCATLKNPSSASRSGANHKP